MQSDEKSMNVIEKEFQSILNVRKAADHWFWDKYSVNPYNGCEFGCIYCDSRSEKYHLPIDFDETIVVKKNVAAKLDRRLKNARTLLPDVVGIAGSTDPYQPLETKYRNTRQCLEILEQHAYPVHMCTKSRLILQDLELLDRIAKRSWCSVSVTITTLKNDVSLFLEPNAPLPEKRFEIISEIKAKSPNIQAGLLLMPTIPFLTDAPEDLEAYIRRAKDAGADFILFGGGLTLRDQQALWFLRRLKERFPELIPQYEGLYRFHFHPEAYQGNYTASLSYFVRLNRIFFDLCRQMDMPVRMKRFIPSDFRRVNYLISEELFNESYRLQSLGRYYNHYFYAASRIQQLKDSALELMQQGDDSFLKHIHPQITEQIREKLNLYK